MRHGIIFPVIATICWGSAFTLIPIALGSFSPVNLIALRFGLAAVIYSGLLVFGVIKYATIPSKDLPKLVLLTTVTVLMYNLSLTYAQRFLSAGLAVLIGQSAPILILIVERLRSGSFQVAHPWRTLITWCIGTAFVLVHFHDDFEVGKTWPLTIICLTPIAITAYNTLSRPMLQKYGAENVTAHVFVIGGASLFLSRCGNHTLWDEVFSASTSSLVSIIVLAVFTTVIAYTIWFVALNHIGASRLSIYLNLVPIIGLTSASFILGESVSVWLLIGGGLTLAGCFAASPR